VAGLSYRGFYFSHPKVSISASARWSATSGGLCRAKSELAETRLAGPGAEYIRRRTIGAGCRVNEAMADAGAVMGCPPTMSHQRKCVRIAPGCNCAVHRKKARAGGVVARDALL